MTRIFAGALIGVLFVAGLPFVGAVMLMVACAIAIRR